MIVKKKLKQEDPINGSALGLLDAQTRYALALTLSESKATLRAASRFMSSLSPSELAGILDDRSDYPPTSPWVIWAQGDQASLAALGVAQAGKLLRSPTIIEKSFSNGQRRQKKLTTWMDKLFTEIGWGGNNSLRLARESGRLMKSAEGLGRGYGRSISEMGEWRDGIAGWAFKGNLPALHILLNSIPTRPLKLSLAEEKQKEDAAVRFWKYGTSCKESSNHETLGAEAWLKRNSGGPRYKQPLEALMAGRMPNPLRDECAILLQEKGFRPSRLALALGAGVLSSTVWDQLYASRETEYVDSGRCHDTWHSDEPGIVEAGIAASGQETAEGFRRALLRIRSLLQVTRGTDGSRRVEELIDNPWSCGPTGVPLAHLMALTGTPEALSVLLEGCHKSSKKALLIKDTNHKRVKVPLPAGFSWTYNGLGHPEEGGGSGIPIGLAACAALSMTPRMVQACARFTKETAKDLEALAVALGGEEAQALRAGASALEQARAKPLSRKVSITRTAQYRAEP